MNALAWTLAIVVLASSTPVAAAAQDPSVQSSNPAEQLLAEAIKGEKLSESGRLCFQIRIESGETGEHGWPTMQKEAKEVDHVEYSWAPGGKLHIVMLSKTGPIREIVSDGKVISAGGKIWDARFAWEFNRHGTEASTALERELADSMWIYSTLLNVHLHPLSWFRNRRTVEAFAQDWQISIKENGGRAPGNSEAATIELESHAAHESIEIGRSSIAYARTSNMLHPSIYERTEPVHVEGVGWVPRTCVIAKDPAADARIPAYRQSSELCPDQPMQTIDPAEFAIKYKTSDVIPWPYGSRVKNYWYAVVNTFKDMWEGISDGVIGD